MWAEAPGFLDQQGRLLFQTQPGGLCCGSGFWRGGSPQPEPIGQRTATALSNSSATRPRLGQGQPLAKASIYSWAAVSQWPKATQQRLKREGRQLRGVSGNLSPHTRMGYGPGLPPLKSLKDAAAETRQVGQRGHSKSKGRARTSLEWGQGNCLSLTQLPIHLPQPLRYRKQA